MKISSRKIFLTLVAAIAIEAICVYIESTFFTDFLKNKIVEILITLMAINTATSSFIVSKLQDIGKQYGASFKSTYTEIKVSLVEQIVLIVISIIILTLLGSKSIEPHISIKIKYLFDVLLIASFVYGIDILRDTGVAMFDILIELDKGESKK